MNRLELDRDLLALLPPWYREILDYQEICQTEKAQFDALAAEITGVADNFFFQTMDEGAVSMWEQIFDIVPDLDTESLGFRRVRVLNRVSTRPPFTLGFLYQKLDELIGAGAWTVRVGLPELYHLYRVIGGKPAVCSRGGLHYQPYETGAYCLCKHALCAHGPPFERNHRAVPADLQLSTWRMGDWRAALCGGRKSGSD